MLSLDAYEYWIVVLNYFDEGVADVVNDFVADVTVDVGALDVAEGEVVGFDGSILKTIVFWIVVRAVVVEDGAVVAVVALVIHYLSAFDVIY